MDSVTLLDMVLGNTGTLVVLAILVYVLVRGELLVPGTYYKAAQARADTLRAENKELNASYATLLQQSGEMAGRIGSLEGQVKELQSEIAGLRKKYGDEH